MHVSAALVTDARAVIEHAVYWASVATESEGHYLVGILNTPSLTELTRPYMSYGKDERHIDKNVWRLPIPTFDSGDAIHTEIAHLSRELANEIAGQTFRSTNFVTTRRDLRGHLATSESGRKLDQLVRALLGAEVSEDALATLVPSDASSPADLLRVTGGPLDLPRADVEIDVDCEFDQDGRVYLWGALLSRGPGTEPTYQAFGSPDDDVDEQALASEFHAWLTGTLESAGESARWYHYGQVEQRHLNRLLGDQAIYALAHASDLLETVRANFFSSAGYGLKRLAPAGASWRTEGATGSDTYDWIAQARAGDTSAWDRLLEYNQDDTRATRLLRHHLTEDANSRS